jgi:hypothetical protein
VSIQLRNVEVLEQAGRALRGADKKYRRELFRGLNRAAKPLKQAVHDAIPDYMPGTGGYADLLQASHSPRTQIKPGGRDPAIRIVSRTKGGVRRSVKKLEAGQLAHPLFGDREHWSTQDIRPGFFTEPMEGEADAVRDEMLEAIGQVHAAILAEIPG